MLARAEALQTRLLLCCAALCCAVLYGTIGLSVCGQLRDKCLLEQRRHGREILVVQLAEREMERMREEERREEVQSAMTLKDRQKPGAHAGSGAAGGGAECHDIEGQTEPWSACGKWSGGRRWRVP
jgi:hypothetical protein